MIPNPDNKRPAWRPTTVSYWPKLNLVFWAVPKCGTTTIKNHLLYHEDGIVLQHIFNAHKPKYMRYHPLEYREGSLNFTVVRHPYSRFASMYKDIFEHRPTYRPKAMTAHEVDLSWSEVDFANYLLTCRNQLEMNIHFRKQRWFLRDNRIKVMRLEELATDWCLDIPVPTSQLNMTAKSHPEPSAELKPLLDELYAGDFEIWENREVKYPWPDPLP